MSYGFGFAKPLSLVILLITLLPNLASAQQAIPEKTLKALKDATVFVRVGQGSRSGSGSGFLIGKIGESAYIITNEHVVRTRGNQRRTVEVDFFSGTKERRTLSAEVLSEDKSRDLAVLKIKNKDLPKPIALNSPNKIRETVPVYILGFPFGEALSTSKRGPNVTIGKGSISSIRRDDFGQVDEVQVDGDINPGNSGGPIVFTDGSLMGVSVATVIGTQIGIGISGESVLSMLQGRVGGMATSQSDSGAKAVKVKFVAKLIDPLGKLNNVSVLYVPKKGVPETKMEEDGTWKKISSKMKEVKLKIDGQSAAGEHKINGNYGERIDYFFQVKFTNGKGATTFTGPSSFIVRIADKPETKRGNEKDESSGWIGNDIADDDSTDKRNPGGSDDSAEGGGWLGEAESAESDSPTKSNRALGGDEYKCVDATCQDLKIDGSGVVENLVWSRDYEHLFVLSRTGLLQKISYPDFTEELTLNFGAKCSWMELSKDGLVVLVEGTQDLVLLDENSLEQKKKFPAGIAKHFGASRDSSLVYMESTARKLSVGNLKSGKVVRNYDLSEFSEMRVEHHENSFGRLGEIKTPTVTPNGKYLFVSASTCLHKFRIKGNDLSYEQVSEGIARNARRIEISPDSGYVALPAGGGNGKGYSTYIYPVSNILKKAVEIESGAYPVAIALDKKAALIYAHDHGTELKTFTPRGLSQKNYDLAPRGGGTRRFLIHPEGRKIFVLHSKITFVKLPAN